MSLRTRFILLTSIWIMLIIAVFNVSLYYYISSKTTDNETRMLWNKAQIILRNPEVRVPANWARAELLQEFSDDQMMIRIISPEGSVKAGMSAHVRLSEYPIVYRTSYHSDLVNDFGFRMLFLQVPILDKGTQVGMLELGKALHVTSEWMELIDTGLLWTSGAAVVVALISGVFYTRFLSKPLRDLVDTMNRARTSRTFTGLHVKYTASSDEIGQLGLTFNELMDSLRDYDRKQRKFVSDASHELRTPLTVISSYVSMLRRWGWDDPLVREEALSAIDSEASRMKELITTLLRLAEVERLESHAAKLESLDLAQLVSETAGQLELAFERDIRLSCRPSRIPLRGSRSQLKQLIIILLDNALKYSCSAIQVIVESEHGHVRLVVADEGIGIPTEHLPNVFERFYRVDASKERAKSGSGLGLSIAKEIAERHGGSIEINSEVGAGTSVTVELPSVLETGGMAGS
ncbi:cell wall metabolism sensor histidine kinase WalK [Paenibacillus sp. YYML68]|uniref:sensor histidine kinase n=1 Tax=Paenibacillus sp. YYML68 TaxID=2909250 RepID=UPI00248FF58E|nr:ATP-binding protein [Paenibacillus sp. YYML68]